MKSVNPFKAIIISDRFSLQAWPGRRRLPSLAVIGTATVLLSACWHPNDSENSMDSDTPAHAARLTAQEPFRAMAQHWAPRFYQDTHKAFYKGDYFTRFNYDGDYVGKNNWENLDRYQSVPAYVYYAVSKTATHYFINYGLFHPRDWDAAGNPSEQHENDFEGLSLMIKKGGGFGTLVAMETLAHHQFNQYEPAGSGITPGSDSLDGQVSLHDGSHPRIFVEAEGHGVFNCDARCDAAPGGDGIVYYEADEAAEPTGGDGNWTRAYGYKLISMDADGSLDGNEGLWTRRDDICDTCTFTSFGRLRGDNFGENKAMMPWAWDDSNDGPTYAGDMVCDPAVFFDVHLNGLGFEKGFSHKYMYHTYRTHTVEISLLRSDTNLDMDTNESDMYLKVTAPGAPKGTNDVINANAWKVNDAKVRIWYEFGLGGFDAEGKIHFGERVKSHSFCRTGSPSVRFAVYDRDSGNPDDLMGTISSAEAIDLSQGIDLGDSRLRFKMIRW